VRLGLNQVLVYFQPPDGDANEHTRKVVTRAQADGTCWLSGTTWHGKAAMRISVSKLVHERGRRGPLGGGNFTGLPRWTVQRILN
jgi:hypothetical protein